MIQRAREGGAVFKKDFHHLLCWLADDVRCSGSDAVAIMECPHVERLCCIEQVAYP